MKLVTAKEVFDRDIEYIDKVTEVITTWFPKVIEKIGLEGTEDLEVVIMPQAIIIDDLEMPAQYTIFYGENGEVEQLQFSGIWMVGSLGLNEEGEETIESFTPEHPLFERSIIEALTTVLLEVKAKTLHELPTTALEVARDELSKEASKIVTGFLGAGPDGWVTSLEDEAPHTIEKKLLN